MKRVVHSTLNRAALTLIPCLIGPPAVVAQERGTVSGRVVEAGGGGMASVQVTLMGTGLGAFSGADGRFSIVNVAPGTYEVRARRIGYRYASSQVTVRSGEAVQVEIRLESEPLQLDEVVVTGAAGTARRREVGNAIAQIAVADVVTEPLASVDNLLQAQTTGLTVLKSSANAGSGAQIRLRGNVSASLSNQPLIYIDGVRVRGDGYPMGVPIVGNVSRSSNDISSPLNDINPADIDRIEIIKGAAATTLYGTEAAAGVIQIFTKKGHAGAPRWTAQMDQGFSHVLEFGTDTVPYMHLDPWLRNAWRQKYAASVGGGGEDLQYFVSGVMERNEGVLPLDRERSVGIRGNFTFSPIRNLQVNWNTAYSAKEIQNTPSGNNAQGLTLNVYRAERNYFGSNDPELLNQLLVWDLFNWVDRLTTSGTATYVPWSGFTNRLTIGYDLAKSANRNLRPYGFIIQPLGVLNTSDFTGTTLTADYVGTISFGLTGDLKNSFSVGAQSVTREEVQLQAYGENFPGPGQPTVNSGSLTLGSESRIRVISAGAFVQNMFDFKNRYFLTAGVRFDGSSVFGENLGVEVYPKVSLSYVISDESFWNPSWGQLKLRGAWGQAGRAPGAFDKVRTWNPIGWGTIPAFLPNNVGNPDLGPERTTGIELGADGSFLGNRLSAEFTYYHQRTTEALFNVRQIPSMGFQQSQLANVGKMQNTGIELSLNGTVLRGQTLGWDLGFSVYTNRSKVLDLGGASPFSLGDIGWIMEGEPAPVVRSDCIRNPDEIADPVTEQLCIYGPNLPTLTLGFRTAVHLPMGIQLSARGEYQGGHYINDGAAYNALRRGVIWPTCDGAYALIAANRQAEMTAYQRAVCITANVREGYLTYPADFAKLRELTLSVPLPAAWLGVNSAMLSLSAHDAWKWLNQDFLLFDPEMMPDTGYDGPVRRILEHVPPPATYTASLKITF